MEKSTGTIKKEHKLIRVKVLRGLRLSYKKLVKQRALENGDLVLMVTGKIRNVKARKIKI
jgi:hypothetical protein